MKRTIDTIQRPTHFKLIRAANSPLIKLIPEISDYHLDSYCLHLYNNNDEIATKFWWGVDRCGIPENVIFPIHTLRNINHISIGQQIKTFLLAK
jgi:hypothetical protein